VSHQQSLSLAAFRVALAVSVLVPSSQYANAQTPVESSAEVRFQLDLHVPDAAIVALLPKGFTLNVATQGAAKDANLRAVFIDRVTVNGPDGKPLGKGSNRFVYLVAPVKDADGGYSIKTVATIFENHQDRHHDRCPMK
jgi:hypothetical protein